MIYDKDRGISTIRYNVLNLPDRIQYSNGNQTRHEYDALGNRVRTIYYTRKSLTAVPIGNILHPENNVSDYTVTVDGYNDNIVYSKYNPTAANGGSWQEKFVHNPEGLTRHYSYEEHYPFYFIKDHLGNIRETYIKPAPNTKYFIQNMQYYPSGIPWKTSTGAIEHPYRYNGKELVQMHGQDEYDSHARWYYPAICRTTTMDPLCEKYYNISPYAWCGNNPVNVVDTNGMDWYHNNSSKYITWYDSNEEKEGYTYIGGKGSVLGEFEEIINDILKEYKIGNLYIDGFTFDIAPKDKGALIPSSLRGGNFLDEFTLGMGPEFSILTEEHQYTRNMMTDERVIESQNAILESKTSVAGRITNVSRKWTLFSVLNPHNYNMARQFIGSYAYWGYLSSDKKHINNVIYDSKNVRSLFLHIPPEKFNQRRSEYTNGFGNTYQLYIWQSPIP